MRCHHGLTIGHAHTFSAIQDCYFVIAWAGSMVEMSSAARVVYC